MSTNVSFSDINQTSIKIWGNIQCPQWFGELDENNTNTRIAVGQTHTVADLHSHTNPGG